MVKLIDLLKEITFSKAQQYILKLNPNFTNSEQLANDFIRFQSNLPKKDIYLYKDFNELINDIDKAKSSKSQKRIKAGKVDPKDLSDPNLIYNEDGIRIYKAHTNKDAIKYGCDTNACISSRGTGEEDFFKHESEFGGTFFFIFNDNIDKNDSKSVVILKVEKLNKQHPYIMWSRTNNLDPIYEGPYSGISSVFPQLKNLQQIFDKNLKTFKPEETKKIKFNYLSTKAKDIINKEFSIFNGDEKELFQFYNNRNIHNSIETLNNILTNKLNLYLIKYKGKYDDDSTTEGYFPSNKMFTSNKELAIKNFDNLKDIVYPGIEDKKLINVKEISFDSIKVAIKNLKDILEQMIE